MHGELRILQLFQKRCFIILWAASCHDMVNAILQGSARPNLGHLLATVRLPRHVGKEWQGCVNPCFTHKRRKRLEQDYGSIQSGTWYWYIAKCDLFWQDSIHNLSWQLQQTFGFPKRSNLYMSIFPLLAKFEQMPEPKNSRHIGALIWFNLWPFPMTKILKK